MTQVGDVRSVMLWLDDLRPAPPGWTHVHSVREAIRELRREGAQVTHMSLDHDLGEYAVDGGDARRLVLWMAENEVWPIKGVRVHSGNPIGVEYMLGVIDRYGPFDKRAGVERGRWNLSHD